MACCVDVHLKLLAVTEFLMAEKESLNIYQQLENACGVTAVDKSTFSHWPSSCKFQEWPSRAH